MTSEEYAPKMFCFIVPSILGTMIAYFGGIPFIILGLIYWFNKSPFARKGSVTLSLVFIMITIATFVSEAGLVYVGFLVLEIFASLLFALCTWIFKVIFRYSPMFNPAASRRST